MRYWNVAGCAVTGATEKSFNRTNEVLEHDRSGEFPTDEGGFNRTNEVLELYFALVQATRLDVSIEPMRYWN